MLLAPSRLSGAFDLSNDLRKRIIEAKPRSETESKIAAEKEESQSMVTKLWALYRETGSYELRTPAEPERKKAGVVGRAA
jgi:hypothetical protein